MTDPITDAQLAEMERGLDAMEHDGMHSMLVPVERQRALLARLREAERTEEERSLNLGMEIKALREDVEKARRAGVVLGLRAAAESVRVDAKMALDQGHPDDSMTLNQVAEIVDALANDPARVAEIARGDAS